MKKKIKIISIVFLVLIVISLVTTYLSRNDILAFALGKIQNKVSQKYDCTFKIGQAELIGISGIELHNISLKPNNADTLLAVNTIKTKINLFEIITGDLQINNLEMHHGYIQLVKNKNGRNFDAFLKKDTLSTSTSKKKLC